MNRDLNSIAEGWDYDPGKITARWVDGLDGRPKVQLRLDLGLLQMESAGRPDGRRPHGYDSLLDYYRTLERTAAPAARPKLDGDACGALQQEAVQYYYRYLAYSALENLDGVVADTQHNLELLALVERRTAEPEIAWPLLQFFPYIRMMNARARAERDLCEGRRGEALAVAQEAVADIRAFGERHGIEIHAEALDDAEALGRLLLHTPNAKQATRHDRLTAALREAIKQEDYERAALLRDALRAGS